MTATDGYTAAFWEKLERIVSDAKLVIDRPKDSRHPRYPSIVYPVDYGYLEGTSSMDGGGIDVWQGTEEYQGISAVMVTVDSIKKDSEIKILIGCTDEEIGNIYRFHNEHESMKGLLIRNNFRSTGDA